MSKYTVINKIEDDAPFGSINLFTISFLTPEKMEKTKNLNIYGFKIYNGYNVMEMADSDAKMIESKNDKHDVFIGEMGKLHAWDDTTKSDSLQYKDRKLNDLDKTRREHIAKAKLMTEQFKTDVNKKMANTSQDRKKAQIDKMKKKLYDKGLISQKDIDSLNDRKKPQINVAESIHLRKELDETFLTDFLDENESVGFKYGCITIYSSDYIGGLKNTCFKVRGLFETLDDANERVKRIEKLFPHDRCWIFQVGRWNVYSCTEGEDPEIQLKKLNYTMKCHLDNLVEEDQKFRERVEKETAKNKNNENTIPDQNPTNTNLKKKKKTANPSTEPPLDPNPEIQSIMDYLRDDELEAIMAKKKVNSDGGFEQVINI